MSLAAEARLAQVPPPRRGGTFPYCPACPAGRAGRHRTEQRYRRHWRKAHMRPFLDRFYGFQA